MLKCREGGRMSELRLFFLKYQHRLAVPFLLYPPIQNQMLIWRSAAQGPNPFLKSLFSASFKSWQSWRVRPHSTSYFIVHPIQQYILFLVLPIFEVPFLHMWFLISVYPILEHLILILLIFDVPDPKSEFPNLSTSYFECFLLLFS